MELWKDCNPNPTTIMRQMHEEKKLKLTSQVMLKVCAMEERQEIPQ